MLISKNFTKTLFCCINRANPSILVIFIFSIFCSSGCSISSKDNFQQKEFSIKNFPENKDYRVSTYVKNDTEYKQILTGEVGKPSSSIVLSLQGTGPKTFNFWASTDSTSSTVASLMFAGLIERNPWNGELVPNLAKSFDLKQQGKEIIVHLRKGIKWSDGEPITSRDVLFTWNVILKNGFERLGAREGLIIDGKFPEVSAIDDYTVSFKTHKVFAPLLSELGYPIAPAHVFEPILKAASKKLIDKKVSEKEILAKQREVFSTIWGTKTSPKNFVVSGAYKLNSYAQGERIEYLANPNYFVFDRAGQRLPYFKKLTYLLLPSGDLEIFKFASGEIPLVSLTSDTLPLIKKISVKKPFNIYNQGPANSTIFFAFNMSRRGNVKKPVSNWFNNENFRKAISYAIDRKAMIDSIYQGTGSPLCLNTSQNSIYFNQKLLDECPLESNLKEAERILINKGFTKDENGKLVDTKGREVRFSLYTNASGPTETFSPREMMAVLIKQQLIKLGIQVDLKIIEFNNLVVRLMQTGDWESTIIGFSGGDLFEPNSSANFLKSDSRLHLYDQREQGKTITDTRDWEKEIDMLVREGTSHMEFDERKKSYYRIQEILWNKKPMIYLATPQVLLAAQDDNLGNFLPSKLAGATHNLEQWYFKK
ncbi:MAG: ABC transporter substrate-binding protein [Candidatus Caenarcaniphilales bacterium]|nr:ABC transporter substrate-binding protein [Candidatus Caenarcaniphilales bacterium]